MKVYSTPYNSFFPRLKEFEGIWIVYVYVSLFSLELWPLFPSLIFNGFWSPDFLLKEKVKSVHKGHVHI